jgi:outer membrane protein
MKLLPILSAVSLVFYAANANAQENGRHGAQDAGWGVTAGAGVLVAPSYLGDDEYQFMAVPNVRVTYDDKFFASLREGAGYNYLINKNWRVGPLARYDFGRDEDGDSTFRIGGENSNDLRGLGDVDGTVELGGFVEYSMQPLSAKVELLQGVGGHEGLIGSAEIKYSGRAQLQQNAIMYAFGPEIEFADSNYHEAYFSVNASQSAASGLDQYDADGGILSYGIGASAIMPITDRVSTILFANYKKLGDEAAHSSLVEERGSEHQGTAGLFINYSF